MGKNHASQYANFGSLLCKDNFPTDFISKNIKGIVIKLSDMKKRLITGMALWASLQCGMAQSLEKMQWFNEPEQ